MAEVGGRPGIKGSCGKRRMRLKYRARGVQNSSEIFFSFFGGGCYFVIKTGLVYEEPGEE